MKYTRESKNLKGEEFWKALLDETPTESERWGILVFLDNDYTGISFIDDTNDDVYELEPGISEICLWGSDMRGAEGLLEALGFSVDLA